ncbi:hypothetical protein BJ165DRAFT_1608021 [Panaeolus papilionaceus]|nr:hypothetical protein BJ165DRAFT_1608021 [Panaeolus papilionaceus]
MLSATSIPFSTLYSSESKKRAVRAESLYKAVLESNALSSASTNTSSTSDTQNQLSLVPVNMPLRGSSSGPLSQGFRDAESIKDAVGSELNGSTYWIKDSSLKAMLEAAATTEECQAYLDHCPIYQEAVKQLELATAEDDLYAPTIKLVQSILDHFGLGEKRTVKDAHSSHLHHIEVQDDSSSAAGAKHTAPSATKAKSGSRNSNLQASSSHYKKIGESTREATKTAYSAVDLVVTGTPKEFDFTDPCAHPWIKKNVQSYTTCLTPIDAKLLGCKDTEAQLFCQAGMYARACFNSQRHRTFVYVIMMNQEAVKLFYFDHCGGMLSEWISFKDDPKALIRMILLTCKDDPEMVGLDPAVSFVSARVRSSRQAAVQYATKLYKRKIQVKLNNRDTTLSVQGLTWASNAIHGRKTICWRVQDEDRNIFMLKECSRRVDRTPAEWEMLEAINASPVPITGVGKMVGYAKSFTVSELRERIKMDMPATLPNRERYVVLLEAHGLPISHFRNPMQFLLAFRDAVSGHQQLWQLGILHRDISTNNILLGKDNASVGNRGVLIDLDLAIFIEEVKARYGLGTRTGTHVFQSYMMLSNQSNHVLHFPHDHLDDLESFFWVLVWITLSYEIHGSGKDVEVHKISLDNRPKLLNNFEKEDSASYKYDALDPGSIDTLAPGWTREFHDLVDDLAGFLKPRVSKKKLLRTQMNRSHRLNDPDPNLPLWLTNDKPLVALKEEALDDYKMFLGHIDAVISNYQTSPDNLPASSSGSANCPVPTTPKPSQSVKDNSVTPTVILGSGSKRFRGPGVVPEDSPSAKRNRNTDFLSNRSQSPSPAPRKGNGQSSRSSTSSLGK